MNIVTYERFDKDGIELIIDTATGESFASVSGYARMSGVSKQAISKRLQTVNPVNSKTAEILTVSGLKTVNLIPESTIVEWLPKDNPAMASQIMQLGVRVFMHKLAGYEVTTTAIKPKTALELAKEQVKLLEQIEIQQQIIDDQEKDLLRQSEVIDELFDYSSILRVSKFNDVSESIFKWRLLKAASLRMGLEVKKAPCPNFETRNLYHHDAWRFCYPSFRLPETTTLVVRN
jgi:hypothetical protein